MNVPGARSCAAKRPAWLYAGWKGLRMGRILTVVVFGVWVWAVLIIGSDDDDDDDCGRWRMMERCAGVMSLAWRGDFK